MVPELEKPRVTEIKVRMDCNGCVQKIKKALYGINSIYDLYIDFPQQKLIVVGWADPEKIVKAIRKTKKNATICSHTEPSDQPPAAQSTDPPQQATEVGAPPPAGEAANPPPAEAPPAEAAAPPQAEPSKDPPPPEEKPSPSPIAAETNANQPQEPPRQKDVGEAHVIYHHLPDYGYRYGYGHTHSYGGGQWNRFPNGHGLPPEPQQPIYVTHSYNTYRPSPYVTEYEYIHSPPRHTIYSRTDHYSDDYHENTRNGNITSFFSDENPNACRIV